MTFDFADTCFWIALMNPGDKLHSQAVALSKSHIKLTTTQEVLSEFLTFFCCRGDRLRQTAYGLVKAIQSNPNVSVIKQTPESFLKGMEFYASRLDKEYSLPDCISMVTMRERGIGQVLTHDHHFTQEGFKILMSKV
jgi:predicted nucleic acid-binding protein